MNCHFNKMKINFKFLPLILLFIFGCSAHKPLSIPAPVMQIIGIGDSTMAGIGVKNGQVVQIFSWNTHFKSFQNEGVSGAPIEYWINNPEKRELNIVIVCIGFNNAKIKNQSVAKIISLYKQMLSTIHAKKYYLIGIYPIDHKLLDTWYPATKWLTNNRIKKINNGIRILADTNGYFYVDTFKLFLNTSTGRAKKGKSYDGVHPSVEAYEDVIAEIENNEDME